jgi:hypothetical protein
MSLPVTTPAPGQATGDILRLNLLYRFLTTIYQQDIESGQEQLILLVVAGVVTGRSNREVMGRSLNNVMPK